MPGIIKFEMIVGWALLAAAVISCLACYILPDQMIERISSSLPGKFYFAPILFFIFSIPFFLFVNFFYRAPVYRFISGARMFLFSLTGGYYASAGFVLPKAVAVSVSTDRAELQLERFQVAVEEITKPWVWVTVTLLAIVSVVVVSFLYYYVAASERDRGALPSGWS